MTAIDTRETVSLASLLPIAAAKYAENLDAIAAAKRADDDATQRNADLDWIAAENRANATRNADRANAHAAAVAIATFAEQSAFHTLVLAHDAERSAHLAVRVAYDAHIETFDAYVSALNSTEGI